MVDAMRHPVTLALVAAACLGASAAHAADANRLYALGAVQKGLGGAGAAHAHDASWLLMNPATMTDLAPRADIWVELLWVETMGEVKGSPILGNPFAGTMRDHTMVQIPSFGVVSDLRGGKLGVGVIGIFGNKVDHNRTRTTVSLPMHADRRSALEVAQVPIVYAREFDNGWSVGGGLIGAYSRFRTDSITLRIRPTEGNFEWSDAFGIGFVAGVKKDWDRWSFGAAYTSRIWTQDYDLYRDDLVFWNLDLPQQWQAGLAYRPRDDLELLLDYRWIEWSDTYLLSRSTITGGLGWENQHIVKAGLQWEVSPRWTVRGGVSFGQSPIEPSFTFANILTPALGELHFGIGASYRPDDRSEWHVSYAQSIPHEQTDNGAGDIFSVLGEGSRAGYEEYSLTVQYTWRF